MSRQHDVATALAEEVIRQLEAGTAPWVKPWQPGEFPAWPTNVVTGKSYRGGNRLRLTNAQPEGVADPRWCTLIQANSVGAKVRKGSKGVPIIFPARSLLRDDNGSPLLDEAGQEQYQPGARLTSATVFHVSCLDGIELLDHRAIDWDPCEKAETIAKAFAVPILHDQTDKAFYVPATDRIHMPARQTFPNAEAYYSTLLHELGHATGHASRLDRGLGVKGSKAYAFEELVAEMTSFQLCTQLGLGHDPGDHINYIGSWITMLKDDPLAIHRAASQATLAMDFLAPELMKELEKEPMEQKPEIEKYYLDVPFEEKDEAKGQGAKWDKAAKRWYVAADEDREPFEKWDPANQIREPAIRPDKSSEKTTTAQKPDTEKYYLDVPFEEKDEAKGQGAKWDKTVKRWYVSGDEDLAQFEKWDLAKKVREAGSRPDEEFLKVAREAGLEIDHLVEGELTRVPLTDSKAGRRDGAYLYHGDGTASGWIQNYKTGEEIKWRHTGMLLSRQESQALNEQARQNREQRERERAAGYEAEAEVCQGIWQALPEPDATATHPYLAAKGLAGPAAFGLRVNESGDLVAALRNQDGQIVSLQTIAEHGFKKFHKGAKTAGAVYAIGRRQSGADAVYIATGIRTGAAVAQATGHPVVCALMDKNLKPAVTMARERQPDASIIVFADEDHHKAQNSGREHAETAVSDVDRAVAVFPDVARDSDDTDFADVFASQGPSSVLSAQREGLEKLNPAASRQQTRGGVTR